MNVILIVSDTFRYDHVGANGNPWIKTPELDKFAQEAVCFDRLHSASFPTIPQRTDLMTGRYAFPYRSWGPLQAEDTVLAEVLSEAGFATQLIADTVHLLKNNFYKGFTGWYFSRGQEGDIPFTRFNYPFPDLVPADKSRIAGPAAMRMPYPNLNAWTNREWTWEEDRFPAVTARHVSKWLEENYKREDFFLWVDFFDPHEPWNPPEYLVDLYDPDYQGTPMLHPNYGHASAYTEAELKNLAAHYAAEATLVSKWIGHVLRKIEDLQLDKNTIVVFTTDHGMYLGEHDRTGKSNISEADERGPWPLYDEITHIPFMIRVPGIAGGRRSDALIQPPDIMPTLLELLEVPIPPSVQGQSFAEVVHSPQAAGGRRYAFSSMPLPDEDHDISGPTIRDDEWTLHLRAEQDGVSELYHVPSDPAQENNVIAERPEVASRLHSEFVSFLRQIDTDEAKVKIVENWL